MSTLSKEQKKRICIEAGKAWKVWKDTPDGIDYRGGLNAGVPQYRLQDEWRREAQERIIGHRSLTTATSDDYNLLMSHFAGIAGQEKKAAGHAVRHAQEDRQRVAWLLQQNCKERGLAYPDYPAAICRRQFKCGLGAATEKQLFSLLYTVRNRRKVSAD